MVLRVVPEELARVVSLADECSATVGSVSVEPGSGGDLGPGVLVAAAAAYAAAHSAVPVGLPGLAAVIGTRVPGSPGGVRSLAAS